MKKVILLILILMLSGCYNYKELNEIAIVSAIGIDKENDTYLVTLQVINTENSITSINDNQTKFVIYKGYGKNIQEALTDVATKISKNIYLNSIEILIINEEIAKNGILDILDLFFRKEEINKQFYVLISKDSKSEEILKIVTPIENINAKKIKKTLKIDSEYYGISQIITFEDLLKMYLNKNEEIVLPSIYIENKTKINNTTQNLKKTDDNNTVKLGPLAIFKNDKMIEYLNEEDSLSYNLLKNKINNTYITVKCDEKNFITIKLNNIKIKNKLKRNILDIYIKSNGTIEETNCNYNLENKSDIKTISKLIEDNINKNVYDLIKKIKLNNVDILGIKDLYYKYDTEYYNKIKENYYQYFNDIKVNLNTNINIVSKGNTLKEINNGKNK